MTTTQQKKTAKAKYRDWYVSDALELSDVYGRYSDAKRNAWEYCKNLCEKYKGFNLKIVSHNINIFTAGFVYPDKTTGQEMFMYITPSYDIAVEVE